MSLPPVAACTTSALTLALDMITRHRLRIIPRQRGGAQSLNYPFRDAQSCVNTTDLVTQRPSPSLTEPHTIDRASSPLFMYAFRTETWYNALPSHFRTSISGHALPRPAAAYGETDSGMTISPYSCRYPASGRNGTCKDPRDEKPHVPKGEVCGGLR
jgi:hypothetical protein